MIHVVQMGLGPLGQKMVRFALERKTLKLVAAVDPDPAKAGQDVGVICGLKPLGVTIKPSLKEALASAKNKPQVAVVSTVSSLARLVPQVEEVARAGLHVVSTCEELSYPWVTQPALAKKLDAICKKHNVACVGTGINPGFLMDYLPSVFTGICQSVKRVRVTRVQDASTRRVPFQQKIGAGLTVAQFRAKVREGTLRHVGLTESIHMIAAGLGLKLQKTTESLRPVIATKKITSGYTPIAPGMACGVEQIGKGFIAGSKKPVIELVFRATVGQPEPHDTIEIEGSPSIRTTIPGGVNGDIATCAITLNAVHCVGRTHAGLNTMLDLPAPTCVS